MIRQYMLEILCNKYDISSEKLVAKNNNILDYGEYQEIDETYLLPLIVSKNIKQLKTVMPYLK